MQERANWLSGPDELPIFPDQRCVLAGLAILALPAGVAPFTVVERLRYDMRGLDMRCKRLFGICLLAGLASASAARADSIRPGDLIDTFDASGSFVFSGKALGGTLQIDLTTGSVESADLTVGGVAFAGTIRNHSFSRVGLDLLTLRGAQPGQLLSLEIPDSTLINYPGGPLSSASEPAYGLISSVVLSPGLVPGQNFDVLEEGELTPVPVQTVNPTSTPLPQPAIAGAALLGVLGAAQLRRRTDVV